MAALTTLITHFCAGEDSWLAHSNKANTPGTLEARYSIHKHRRNKRKRSKNNDDAHGTTVNAGFRGSQSSQRKQPLQQSNSGPSGLDRILDRPCQIHGTPGSATNHTNKECRVFKQAGQSYTKNNKGVSKQCNTEQKKLLHNPKREAS